MSNLIDKIRLLFRKDRESYLCLYRILGFFPHKLSVYHEALLHKSSTQRTAGGRPVNNERLEYLGDAVLDAVVADIVYRHFPGRREGFLTDTRSKIVQRETLNRLAVDIGLDRLLKSSSHCSTHNNYIYGNAFEALIGAIYLDRGYAYCLRFMRRKIIGRYINLDRIARHEVNFKSKLIEWSQKHKVEISFELIRQQLDEHFSPVFHTEVHILGLNAGQGVGYSKKESQQSAARAALKRLKTDTAFRAEVDALCEARAAQATVAAAATPEPAAAAPDTATTDIATATPSTEPTAPSTETA